MKKHFCDICGKETTEIRSRFLHGNGIYGSNAKREFDICLNCESKLEHKIALIEYEFINKKPYEER